MKFDWSEYFHLAKELTADSSAIAASQESKWRAAISRTYYAAFGLARSYLRDAKQDPRLAKQKSLDINEHQYVAEEFIYNPEKSTKLVKIGVNLIRLREIRNKADYAEAIFNLEKEAARALEIGQKTISLLNEIRKDNTNNI